MQGTWQEGITDEYSNEMAASGKEEDEEENNDNGPDQKRQKNNWVSIPGGTCTPITGVNEASCEQWPGFVAVWHRDRCVRQGDKKWRWQ